MGLKFNFRQTARLRTGSIRLSGNMDRWPKPISLATTVMSWQARDLWKRVGRSRSDVGCGVHAADHAECQLANVGVQLTMHGRSFRTFRNKAQSQNRQTWRRGRHRERWSCTRAESWRTTSSHDPAQHLLRAKNF